MDARGCPRVPSNHHDWVACPLQGGGAGRAPARPRYSRSPR